MPSDSQTLFKAGPFKGIDSRTATVYADQSKALSASNVDTHTHTGAISTYYGRKLLWNLSSLSSAPLTAIAKYVISPAKIAYIGQNADGQCAYYQTDTGKETTIPGITSKWLRASPSNGVMWLDNGQQIFYGDNERLNAAMWQYPAPDPVAFQYKVQAGNGGPGQLAQGEYFYAFVQVISLPYFTGTVQQITTPTGALQSINPVTGQAEPYPYTFITSGTVPASVGGIFDPHSILAVEPQLLTGVVESTSVTVTSVGNGTFNAYDTLGNIQNGLAAGATVSIAQSLFTLTSVTDIPANDQATYSVYQDEIASAFSSNLSDPNSFIVDEAIAIDPNAANDTVVTITAATSSTFNISDTLGHSQSGVAGGTEVTIGAATFTLTSSAVTPSDTATFDIVAKSITPGYIGTINDPNSIFAVDPVIQPNIPASTVITITSNGDGTFDIKDTLGNTRVNVPGGDYVVLDGAYFALTTSSIAAGETATFSISKQVNGLPAAISGIFAGTTDDGYPFVTQVYRMSSNVPVWYLLTTLTTNEVYYDNVSDASLAANQQLVLDRDPPQVTPGVNWPIAAHQDRMWTFVIVNDENTLGTTQTQIMWSNVGQAWSFDLVEQTELVEDDETPMIPGTGNQGNIPTALASIGSALMMFKTGETSIMYGVDNDSYEPVKLFPDIGCIAPLSVVNVNGKVFWLSAQGVYSYDGNQLSYLSDDIYNALQAIDPAVQATAVGGYADLTYFLSFPTLGITYTLYLPNAEWETLPYAAVSFVSQTSAPNTPSGSFKWNELVGAREDSQSIDSWLSSQYSDLNQDTVVSWTSQVVNSGTPNTQKDYQAVVLEAVPTTEPFIVTVTLQPDPGSSIPPAPTVLKFDLSRGPWSQIQRVAQAGCLGNALQVTIEYTIPAGSTFTPQIFSLEVAGAPKRKYTILDYRNTHLSVASGPDNG